MLCSVFLKNKIKSSFKYIAAAELLILLIANIYETYGYQLFHISMPYMLEFSRFGFLFNSIAFAATLIYVLLTGSEMENYGNYTAEYFTLIFFVLCGVGILSAYNNLLMLFIGIEILSIPLYILTGSDKRNLKSNEAALKYFLMGSFSTGIMLMGIALIYGGTGSFSMTVQRGIIGTYKGISFLEIIGLLFFNGFYGF